MKYLIKLDDYSIEDMNNIFKIADEMKQGKHKINLPERQRFSFSNF